MISAPRRRKRLIAGTLAVAILGVLAATTILIANHAITTHDEANSCNLDYRGVQAALDAYMANNTLTTVPAAGPTTDMTFPIPLYNGAGTATNPSYTRMSHSLFAYTWDTAGTITGISQASGGPAVPAGCVAPTG